MKVMCQEAFAPLVSIYEYGKCRGRGGDGRGFSVTGFRRGLYQRPQEAMYAVDRINVGGVMINDTSISGWTTCRTRNKMSGLGREGSLRLARR